MGILTTPLYYLLEILKWMILIRVLLSWLPMVGMRLDPYHPILRILYQITDPVLNPLRRFSQFGMMDLSPLIAFFLIGFIQNLLVGRSLAQTLAFAIALVVAFSVHECAHAWAALQMGDPTARDLGRLTLDPRKHLDVLGAIMVLTVGFGWAKPVPVNPNRLQGGPKTGMALVSLSGPLSNLAMAVIAAIPLRLGMIEPMYSSAYIPDPYQVVFTFVFLNVVLAIFNILPIAPLDGFSILYGVLPFPMSESFRKLETFGPLILLLLIFFGGPIFSALVIGPARVILGLLV
jgi:Zn-dependent protease